MNVQSSESPSLNLPPPVVESSRHIETQPESAPSTPETAPSQGQKDPTNVRPAAPPLPSIPLPPPPSAPVQGSPLNGAQAASASTNPVNADDSDLIEKEWVNKAKEIVERTRENPYQQSRELNLFKADYMKKRYNKTLKLSE